MCNVYSKHQIHACNVGSSKQLVVILGFFNWILTLFIFIDIIPHIKHFWVVIFCYHTANFLSAIVNISFCSTSSFLWFISTFTEASCFIWICIFLNSIPNSSVYFLKGRLISLQQQVEDWLGLCHKTVFSSLLLQLHAYSSGGTSNITKKSEPHSILLCSFINILYRMWHTLLYQE